MEKEEEEQKPSHLNYPLTTVVPRSTTGVLTLKRSAFKPVLKIDTSIPYEPNPNFKHNPASYSSNWAVAVIDAQKEIKKRNREERKKRKWEAERDQGRRTSPKLIQEIDRLHMYEGREVGEGVTTSGRGV